MLYQSIEKYSEINSGSLPTTWLLPGAWQPRLPTSCPTGTGEYAHSFIYTMVTRSCMGQDCRSNVREVNRSYSTSPAISSVQI